MEEIEYSCVHFLTNHSFLRNYPPNDFLLEHNLQLELEKLICYCVGLIDGERIVHAIRILGQNESPGVTSYYIEWFNNATYLLSELNNFGNDLKTELESTSFWVHSGVSLRKNFFLYDDRMSLLKSSFVYDKKRQKFYRLHQIWNYVKVKYIQNIDVPIYSSINKITYPIRKKKKHVQANFSKSVNVTNSENGNETLKFIVPFKKSLKKLLKQHNQFQLIKNKYPRLFEQIELIIDSK